MSAKEDQVIRKLVLNMLMTSKCACQIKDNYRCYRCELIDECVATFPEQTAQASQAFARSTPGQLA